MIARIALSALLCAAPMAAQSAAAGPAGRKAFLAVTVADLGAAERWYDTHLGAKRTAYSRAPNGFAENSLVENEYLMVELIHFTEPAKSDTALRDPRAVGLQKVGVVVDRATFDSTLARLQRLGSSFVGGVFTDSATRRRMFIVRDTSRALIQFFTPLP